MRETDFVITFPNGSQIIFTGLDEETKLLSLTNISFIFVEEAFECSKDIIDQLNLRMRGKQKNQQILLAFNPISKESWLYDFCEVNPPQSFKFSKSTYKDNPFLKQEYIDAIEELATTNPKKFRIYGLGEWGIDDDGLVLTNWQEREFDVQELIEQKLEPRYGMDLGWVDPTAAVFSLFDKENKTIYIFDEFYQSGVQLDKVSEELRNKGVSRHIKLWVDSAEPRTIDYLRQQGFNATGSIKGQDSVFAGISFLQNMKIIVKPNCKNIITELSNFSYIKDKKTNKYSDKMTHEYSHAIDALRYAYSDIYTRRKLTTIDKSLLGL